ncbi:MAG: fatty acid desaturase [Cyclobacteriaceae bacterium]
MKEKAAIRFPIAPRDFVSTLNQRVHKYFKSNQISKHANSEMVIKTFVMFGLYLIPYFLIVTNLVTSAFGLIGLALVMGLGLAGIGLSVMHDANHGAYSSKPWLNDLIGYSLNFVGANAFNWKMQHNVLHHSYTNIHDHDEDISPRGVLRLSPHTPWKRVHRYQFIYAWFLYGLMTIVWMTAKDFIRIIHYQRTGMVAKQKANALKEWVIMLITKVFYVSYIFIVPLVFTSLLWWQVLLGIFIMHYITGFILAIIFQPAHVVEGTQYPLPDDNHGMKTNWAVHQLLTTANFGNRSRWFSWYVGGLNFQIEHHLFPNICHVHYRKIAGIVEATAQEFGLPYRSYETFAGALVGHANLLKELGRRPLGY